MATHRYRIDGQDFDVEVHTRSAHEAEVTVNGRRFVVERTDAAPPPLAVAGGSSGPRPKRAAPEAGELRAPMAGLVLRVDVSEGQKLKAGDQVLVLDAMKMENTIRAPHGGVVREIAVSAGESVLTGALLVRFEER